jgi:hypothetical protein
VLPRLAADANVTIRRDGRVQHRYGRVAGRVDASAFIAMAVVLEELVAAAAEQLPAPAVGRAGGAAAAAVATAAAAARAAPG